MTHLDVLRERKHQLAREAASSFTKEASRVAGMVRLGNVESDDLEESIKHVRWCHAQANSCFRGSTFGSPSFWEDLGITLEAEEEYRLAAECWSSAAAATLGHKRTARYKGFEKRCDKLADEAELPT